MESDKVVLTTHIELLFRNPHVIPTLAHGDLDIAALEKELEAVAFALGIDA